MTEPLTLDEAKAQLRVTGDDDDALIEAAIADARGWIENYTGRTIDELTGADGPPRTLLRAMRILVAGYYQDREAGSLGTEAEASARRLCSNLKMWRA